MSKIAMDLGGSTSRYMYGNPEKMMEKTVKKMESSYLKIDTKEHVFNEVKAKEFYNDFEIVESSYPELKGRYVRGELCSHFEGVIGILDNQKLKVTQVPTYVNAVHALARYAVEILKSKEVVLPKVGAVIPVKEYYSFNEELQKENKLIFKEKLSGHHVVRFPITGDSVKITLPKNNISVGGEGAVVVFMLHRNEEYRELIEESNGIVIDPGYRSTDIIAYRNFVAESKAARSLPHGGINIEASIASELEKRNFSVTPNEVRKIIKKGSLTGKDFSDVVRKSKATFAGTLHQDVNAVLAQSQMSINSLGWALPVGRPFMDPIATATTGSLVDEVKKFLPERTVILPCGDLELANVDALYEMMG